MHHAHMNMKGHQFPPSNEKVSKASLFINKLALYLEKTSIHGIPYVVRSDRIYMKLMWIIIFLVFAGYCCYSIVNSFFTFFGFEVDTNIEILRDSNALFPTISICILQQCGFGDTAEPNYQSIIQQTIQQQFNKSGNLTQSALDNIMKSYNLESLIQTSRTSFLSNYSKTELNTVFSQLQNKTIQKNVISCQYSSENCYENDFAYFQTSEFQSCFKFNSGQLRNGSKTDIKQARRYGKNYGLQLEMFVGLPEKCISPLISTYGVTLYVHNSSTQIDSNTNGIALSPGTQNSIAIDRTFVTKMPAPYSDCVPNTNSPSDYPDKPIIADTFRFASRYTQFTCMQICYQHYLVKTYQCYNRFMPMYPAQNVSACPLIMDSPSNSIYYDMSTFYNTNEDNNCLNECNLISISFLEIFNNKI